MLRKTNFYILIIFLIGLAVLGKPIYYYTKGICAQIMLEKAWEKTKRTGKPTKAWSWADTLPVAKLIIPKIELNQVVLEGEEIEAMAFGPAIIKHELNANNIIISGHRDSFFKELDQLSEGDIINLELLNKVLKYRINSIVITNPEDTRWIEDTPSKTLTLITCYPFNFIGDAPERYIIIANAIR